MDYTPIFNIFLGMVAGTLVAFLFPWIRSKTTQSQQVVIQHIIDTAVLAAEQLMRGGAGRDKLAYVKDYLDERGVKYDETMIEAEVYRLFNYVRDNGVLVEDVRLADD